MLRKHTDISINPADPFAEDCPDRKASARNLSHLVQSVSQPFVLTIEAPWGWGKTTFIRMWKALLENEGHKCLYFNAWTNDFVEDPLIAFIGEMEQLVNKEIASASAGAAIKNSWEAVQRIGGGILYKPVPTSMHAAVLPRTDGSTDHNVTDVTFLTGNKLEDLASGLAQQRLEQYKASRTNIRAFREHLAQLASSLFGSTESASPLVFFIDELDRCRPDYALLLLERIKHLFNVEGVVFVLALDRAQIIHSIKAIYGAEMDAEGYLRRFIDLGYQLPQPSTESFCKFLFERLHLGETFQNRREGHAEAEMLLGVFTELATAFAFSLRVQEQCFTELNLVLRTTGSRYKLYPQLLSFLVALRAHNPPLYAQLRSDIVDIDLFIDLLSGANVDPWIREHIQAHLMAGYLSEQELAAKLESLTRGSESEEGTERQPTGRLQRLLEQISFREDRKAIKYLLSRLDITRDFVPELPT